MDFVVTNPLWQKIVLLLYFWSLNYIFNYTENLCGAVVFVDEDLFLILTVYIFWLQNLIIGQWLKNKPQICQKLSKIAIWELVVVLMYLSAEYLVTDKTYPII